jgi:NADH:ubiquinone oxidoreductase subunit F (NADH-binding)
VSETRVVLRNSGVVDPRSIDSALECGAFEGLKRALELGADGVIAEVERSGLRGRGGAGFPAAAKWKIARAAAGNEKYLICNADEGEVGAFKDRVILESVPFEVVEGIAVAGLAIGASEAIIYLNGEYQELVPLLEGALAQARSHGFIGAESPTGFDCRIFLGAGVYVCGEETALIESIEGRRGAARLRPPYPPERGLHGMPTVVNNVETLANLPAILTKGGEWFASLGTEKSKGTKVFSVVGDVDQPGVYELVLGTPLRVLVEEHARAREVKMVQVGGASGPILPTRKLDTPLAYETVLGAGAVMVFNRSRSAVLAARLSAEFFAHESCGKCAPCRSGTKALLEILESFERREASPEDLERLRRFGRAMEASSLCGLGQTAPVPVLSTLEHFPEEYDAGVAPVEAVAAKG